MLATTRHAIQRNFLTTEQNHIVLLGFWAYSHFKPLVEFAKILVAEPSITVSVVIESNAKIQKLVDECLRISQVEGNLKLLILPESGGRIDDPSGKKHDLYLRNMKDKLPAILKNLHNQLPITGVVFEMFTAAAMDVIKPFNVPHFALFTVNAFAVSYMLASSNYHDHLDTDPSQTSLLPTVIERKDAQEATRSMSKMYHLNCRFRDSHMYPPPPVPDDTEIFYFENECKTMSDMLESSQMVFINSFPKFDQMPVFDFLKKAQKKFVSVGPLGMKTFTKSAPSDASQFLDSHPPKSVFYIAFGSEFKIKDLEVIQLEEAMEKSGVPYIWCVPSTQQHLLKSTISSTNRLILQWSPQEDILHHPSTRGFLSHCGWNSCLEGLQAGIPMICWPIFAEQFINSVLLVDKGLALMVQGTGLMSEKVVQKQELLDIIEEFNSKYEALSAINLAYKQDLDQLVLQ